MTGARFTLFVSVALSVWALMHLYVFVRLASVPWIHARISGRTFVLMGVALWASYPLARMLVARDWWTVGRPLEFFAANWMGTLFLLLAMFFLVDVITLGGFVFRNQVPALRSAAVVAGLALSVIALVQGLRPPVVREYEVKLPGLPRERDGLVLVTISDVHLGTLIGQRSLSALIDRINAMKPDLVAVVGDLVDGEAAHVEPLVPVLQKLRAPLGVWAVTGNHEYYAGIEHSVKVLEAAGYRLLRGSSIEVTPGLVLAGVDDLTARRQFSIAGNAFQEALAQRPPGATILLSHTPWHPEAAARLGVGLMLSGHTHNGQIWPFHYLVRLQYRYLGGRYDVAGMTAIVCRGTGTWGPRMRLWYPNEILRITLRAA